MSEGRITPTASSEYQSKRSSKKLGDFGIVNIVQEATPITPDNQPIISSNQSTINEEQTTTHQLAEQTSQMLDDIHNLGTTDIQSPFGNEAQNESRNQ